MLSPIVLNPATSGLAVTVQNALNELGLNFFFGVTLTTNTLRIFTVCSNETLDAINLSAGTPTITANECEAGTACGVPFFPVAFVTGELIIDCENLTCLTFKDTTGNYSASNVHGYGTPNWPAISDIVSTSFNIWNEDGTVLLDSYNGDYLPNGAGDSEICLTEALLGVDFYPGEQYKLEYQQNFEGAICVQVVIPFTFPCCGNSVLSNLTTNFSILEKIGCSSFNFTDTTGTYNSTTNPGGYGTPNPSYSDITETEIAVTRPDGTVVTITDFIPTSGNQVKNITAYRLGFNDGYLSDGVYTIVYSVFKEGKCRIGYKSAMVLFSCRTQACIKGKIATLLNNDCTGKCVGDAAQTDSILAMAFQYEAIVLAAKQNISCVVGDMEKLYRKCVLNCPTC